MMRYEDQRALLDEMILSARAKGKTLSLGEATRKLHREYITRQLRKKGWSSIGFLIAAGLTGEPDEDGYLRADEKILGVFNGYLIMKNKLTGATGIVLRDAMDRLGIEYRDSPTFALEDLEKDTA